MARPVEKNPMKCPTCNVWVRVIETRNGPDNTKRRRYECANLHRFTTEERILHNPKPTPKEKAALIQKALLRALQSGAADPTGPSSTPTKTTASTSTAHPDAPPTRKPMT